jgi:hypothetical protein
MGTTFRVPTPRVTQTAEQMAEPSVAVMTRRIIGHRRGGRSVVVAQEPSKLLGRVRFPSPASGRSAVW